MSNVKISEKGKALLKSPASSEVAREIVRQGTRFSSTGRIQVKIDGKTITVRNISKG
jgi:hypothetical protein